MITLTLDPAGRSWLATTTGPAAAQLIDLFGVDLIANLRHFAEAHQLRFAPLLKLSKMHWEEERHGGGSHGE
jgi:hypothetical protein